MLYKDALLLPVFLSVCYIVKSVDPLLTWNTHLCMAADWIVLQGIFTPDTFKKCVGGRVRLGGNFNVQIKLLSIFQHDEY